MAADNIKVYARFRPLVGRDLRLSAAARSAAFQVDDNTITRARAKEKPSASSSSSPLPTASSASDGGGGGGGGFSFDAVFAASITQQQLHAHVGSVGVEQLLEGYNSTILTYGQVRRRLWWRR